MQGMNSGTLTAGGVFVMAWQGSPAFMWIALVTILLTTVFLVYMVVKRRREAREAHGAREAVIDSRLARIPK